jgi:hypothetical protein
MSLPEQTIAWLRQAARLGQAGALAHLDHVEQLDALRESLETAMKRITALERRFIHGGPLFTGLVPAGATWTERERMEAFTARPAPCSATEAGEPADDEPQTLHSIALKMVDTLASLGVIPEIRSTLRRAILEPMEPATAAADPVATDEELIKTWNTSGSFWLGRIRAIYNLGRAHGTPPSAVEALQEAEVTLADIFGGSPYVTDRAAGALPAIRAALQLLGQPAPAAAPEWMKPEAQPAPAGGAGWGLVEKIAFTAGCGNGTSRAVIREVAAWLDCRGQHGCSLWLREQCAASQEGQANG